MKLDKSYKKSGFTLMEAVLAMMIMFLIVNLAVLLIKSAQNKAQQSFDMKITEVVQDLESPKHVFELVEVRSDQLTLYSKTEEKRYYLGSYVNHDMLRYTPGHIPLVLGVQHVFFKKERNLIQIKLVSNGKKSISYVYIPPQKKR
ncbi:ComGF family competence protein [Pediococcus pentosaceus]|uniref:competence type IV pilus minor pilin ComGF n=1 Tax=Pediococcus pentosaceus TaxID=1255 RepID=UPI0018E0F7F6|nr:ComGF family competence protein [Pediococcus pentosaceus]MBF7103825.1 ComGF family competence protein [Pediococcus pentosaceus]QQC61826.1 ComGF family competence protein [Pediococcus pentosaceus]